MIDQNETMAPANYIAFNNGIYNLLTDSMEDFGPDIVITNKIPFDYNPDAYSEICDKTFNKLACQDKRIRMLLEECIGYCFYRRNELRKSIILTGEKENGKSTFLSMLERLLGKGNITNLDLKELGDRFKTAQLFGKLANIGDDIGSEFIPNPAIFKKLSAGNSVNAEFKGDDPFDFSSYAKLIFSANDIPRIKDKSGAVLSRLVIIPFNARFSANDPDFDPYIKYKLITAEVMEYLIQIGIQGLKRILTNQKFTTSEKVEKALSEYEENNNPILLFFKDEPKVYDESTTAVYQQYYSFCIANNYTPMSNIEFSKQVKKFYNVEIVNRTIRGKRFRIFKEVEDEKNDKG
jgi:putative DNA primase/helicase